MQIIVNNLLISYIKMGESSNAGPILLFLHGWRSNTEIWGQVLKNLQLTTYNLQLIAIDLPGFGGSQLPTKDFSVGDYAEVVQGFIEKLALKNVIIVGHSFGGRIAIKLAAMSPDESATSLPSGALEHLSSKGENGNISKLVLVDSAGFAMNSSRKNFYQSLAKIVRPFFRPKFMQGLRKKIYTMMGAEDYLATPELQKTFVNIVKEDLTEDMQKITCPTLIITGENDQDTPVEFGYKMQSLIPNTKYIILKEAGHFSFLDQPEKFINVVSQFIGC